MGVGYNPKIITNGLVLCLDAGNRKSYSGSGTVWKDLSGNNNNAILVNGASFTNDGSKSYIRCGSNITNGYLEILDNSSLDFGSNNFTVEYWFRKLQTTSSFSNIWGPNKWNTGGSAGTNEWSLGIGNGSGGNGNTTEFGIESSNTSYTVAYTTIPFILNSWYQLIGMRQGANLKIYINGQIKTNQTPAGFTISTTVNNVGRNLRINNSNLNFYYTNADNNTLRIYNRDLTDIEILQNYNATKGRFNL